MNTPSDEPDFWEQRYLAGRTPWDLGGVPPDLDAFLRRETAPARDRSRVLLPGCGTGYEVAAFHAAGWSPLAFDFAPAAVERAQAALGDLRDCVRQADFFADDLGANHDLLYERTFLCSLPPERWSDWSDRVTRLLRPGGRLIGLFYYGTDPDGPPFPLGENQLVRLLREFELVRSEEVRPENSPPLFAGYERWQEWRRLPT